MSAEKKRAAAGGYRILFHSVDTGEFAGFCDLPDPCFINGFVSSFNDVLLMPAVTAICVDDRGRCVRRMDVHAELGRFAVIIDTMFCPWEVLSQHDSFQDAVVDVMDVRIQQLASTQGLSNWKVIDDRGVVVWHEGMCLDDQQDKAAAA